MLSQDKNEEEKTTTFSIYDPNENMKPASSIYGKSKPTIITLQDLPPQNMDSDLKMYQKGYWTFNNWKPFQIFPNIKLPNETHVQGPTGNPFFDSLFLAYLVHGEIVLSPDDVWLQISGCFSEYVNENAEKLRSKIVVFDGKKTLTVLYDETNPHFQDFRSDSFNWNAILKSFSSLIKQNTLGDISETLECNFTDTGPIEKVCSQSILMYSCQKFFDYHMGVCGCGITKVHFLGELTDWIKLKGKLCELKNYQIKGENQFIKWIQNLEEILEEFISSFNGKPNLNFWNSIFQQFQGFDRTAGGSLPPRYFLSNFINGWILSFFLYDTKKKYMCDVIKNVPMSNPDELPEKNWKKNGEVIDLNFKKGVRFEVFPKPLFETPVLIEYMYGPKKGEKVPISFLAGFSGVLEADHIYRPQMSFGVNDRMISDEEKIKK